MTEKEINYQLEEEMNKFYNSVFDVKLNFDLIAHFKKCVMLLAPQQHKISIHGIKAISETPQSKLTIAMLEEVNKIILNVPLEKLYPSFAKALKTQIEIERYVVSFNKHISDFQAKLRMKQATLKAIANPSTNNLRIIPTAQA